MTFSSKGTYDALAKKRLGGGLWVDRCQWLWLQWCQWQW